ncbi:PIG-L family deacetylase [Nonomuraea sp. NPDC050404]|uniref:PIG-L deacetylase family protein n=1 Tax=Nonomuraea sp. NPDC050404 TaxID=3155783 RepID=UPI0033F9356B
MSAGQVVPATGAGQVVPATASQVVPATASQVVPATASQVVSAAASQVVPAGQAVKEAVNAIDAPGTPESRWRAWPGLAALPVLRHSTWRSAVVIAAHPDDEVLGVGGLISLLAAAGVRLRLVAITDGEASHPDAPDPAALAARRVGESRAALAALGAPAMEIVRLGLPDTGLDIRQEELARTLREAAAGFEVCLAPWEADVHADHEAAGRAAVAAGLSPLFYPIWAWHWARPADPRLPWDQAVRVPLPPRARTRKQAAIGCFASQLEPRGQGLEAVLPPRILAHFDRGEEVLFG